MDPNCDGFLTLTGRADVLWLHMAPAVVLRVCTFPGCYTMVRSGRCVRHLIQRRSQRPHARASAQAMAAATVCALCRKPGTPADPLTRDHIVPVSLGGRTVPGNYQAAHASCNSRRGNQAA